MASGFDLLLTLTVCLGTALVLGLVAHGLRLSPIAGYLAAGLVVGPFAPGRLADPELTGQLAQIGVVLLMFGVGLQLHVRDLLALRSVAVPGALVAIAITTAVTAGTAVALGFDVRGAVALGLTISIASTVVLVRVLQERNALHAPVGHLAIAWLVVEDLWGVAVLIALPIVAGAGAPSAWSLLARAGGALLGIVGLIAIAATIGRRALPALFARVARTRSRELFTLTVLVTALGIAVISARWFGASMPLGAFLAGLVVGQSDFGARAGSEALPMRDAFAVIFFVAVGMIFDPRHLLEAPWLALAVVAIVLVVKPLAAFGVLLLLGRPRRTAARLAAGLAQIGELSFVIAATAREHQLLPEAAWHAVIVASMVSITLSPIAVRAIERIPEPAAHAARPATGTQERHRAVVVGFGPVGRTVARLLRENGVEPTIVELNHETVARLRREGIPAVYGDASQPAILERAGIADAISLIFAASGTPPEAIARVARELKPGIRIFARSTYVGDAPRARRAGADVVVTAEGEVALALAERVLADLGATGEQLDRARDRLRRELASAVEGGSGAA